MACLPRGRACGKVANTLSAPPTPIIINLKTFDIDYKPSFSVLFTVGEAGALYHF